MLLEDAENCLVHERGLSCEDRAKIRESRSRRLYDIMNVLKCLNVAMRSREGGTAVIKKLACLGGSVNLTFQPSTRKIFAHKAFTL